MKPTKGIIIAGLLALSFGIVGNSFASETGTNKALNDYKRIMQNKNSMNKSSALKSSSLDELTVSNFSVPKFNLLPAQEILDYDGENLKDLLVDNKEKLSFMMNGKQAEGIIIANETEPLTMGAPEYGEEMYKLYNSIELDRTSEIYYFEARGGGAFLIVDENTESIYLSNFTASIFDLSPHEEYSASTIIEKLKENAEIPKGQYGGSVESLGNIIPADSSNK
ncbi:hypothetical protein [Brevibacillus porteri]|uniref:Uncharacterized protein n=1 Tax=Brevibacillus porteri TaxID=2126350 RepID=A0ABX5FHL6_9BACL|nr:hypothetical protein [Brevibacillus porteri]MED1803017.1 hypothetical protein [Brevibacillus porteri]MED2135125.1 hypothetical protein [Brevibacillus porteri]MED2745767.1 hypothetical protein [Brevibacillus porteri]MED2813769.1 hypothetical protein [Brevibacillus porteri]MED2897777.1 hypothetical protein [Brevibacillus porteri]